MPRFLLISTAVKVVAIYLAATSVVSYENAYDLLEWKHRRQVYEPRQFYTPGTFHEDRQRFFAENENPYLDYTNVNPYFSKFGNGYDNIGNGIPSRHFQHFHHSPKEGWRFHRRPFRERIYSSIGFEEYPHRNYQPVYPKNYPKRYYSNYGTNSPLNRAHESEFGSRRNTDYTKTDKFLEDKENKNQKKTDEIYMRSQEGVNMDSVKKEKSGEQSRVDHTGENKTSSRSNKVVKKGHTTRGFASHHHKDETGNSTTYFDESSDYGGQSDVKDLADGFDTRRTLEQITHKGDEKFFKEDGGQEGSYGSGLLIGNQKFEKDFSSAGEQNDFADQYQSRNGEDNLGLHKMYRYLNGDRFDFTEPHVDNY